jgi:hypothetical protein
MAASFCGINRCCGERSCGVRSKHVRCKLGTMHTYFEEQAYYLTTASTLEIEIVQCRDAADFVVVGTVCANEGCDGHVDYEVVRYEKTWKNVLLGFK